MYFQRPHKEFYKYIASLMLTIATLGYTQTALAVAAATDGTASTSEDTAVTITPTITGVIIDAVASESGSVSFNDTTITYTPGSDFYGTEYIGFDVRDGSDGSIASANMCKHLQMCVEQVLCLKLVQDMRYFCSRDFRPRWLMMEFCKDHLPVLSSYSNMQSEAFCSNWFQRSVAVGSTP